MKAKSGKKIEAVKPSKPEEAFDADEANPGKVAKVKAKQIDAKKGKYGQTKAPAFKPKDTDPAANSEEKQDKETTHIAIKLTDEKGNVVVGEQYEVELPDGSVSKGTLGVDGTAKIEGFAAGQCKVRFPNLEDDCVSAK
jgi:hypothetical protein